MALRELPCPFRIIDDFGGAFSMGCFAGCLVYFVRGMWYSPRKERLFGGVMLLKKRAPVLGGSFAMWGGLFSLTDCILIHLRKKEDYLNPIAAGFVAGGLLAIRAGSRIAFRNAIFGGLILGCIQMVEIIMIKWQARAQISQSVEMQEQEYQKQTEMIMEMHRGNSLH